MSYALADPIRRRILLPLRGTSAHHPVDLADVLEISYTHLSNAWPACGIFGAVP
ncbi:MULTISPECIES: hypothetical protein [Streptomyces]|uniref:hypothetical protein n=1 Tax=Streptomyces TaxID=1883 RepID=UPI00382F8C85|nr:helix-turn-helix domain-containing protein [Streptomyces anthocyanicus]